MRVSMTRMVPLTCALVAACAAAACGPRQAAPTTPPPSIHDAAALVEMEDYEGAQPVLERLLREHLAEPAEVHHYLGVCAQAQGRFAEAEMHYKEALRRRPELFESRLNLGSALGAMERHDEALEVLVGLTEAFPEEAEAYLALAFEQRMAGDDGAAEASYRRAMEIDPDGVEAPLGLSVVLDRLGRGDEAIALLEETARGTDRIEPDLTLADAFERAGRIDEAIVTLVGATASPQADSALLGGIALKLRDLGAPDQALEAARVGVERAEDDPGYRLAALALALVARAIDRPEKAEAALREALARIPEDRTVRLFLGGILAETERCAEAVPLLETARDAYSAENPEAAAAREAAAALARCGVE